MEMRFFDYVKTLIPEKGSVLFTREKHSIFNAVSLYELADLIRGEKCGFADAVVGYTLYPELEAARLYYGDTTMVGLWFERSGEEFWIHFSKNAFIGAICITANNNGVTFTEEEYENARKAWADKVKGIDSVDNFKYTDLNEANFTSELWFKKT